MQKPNGRALRIKETIEKSDPSLCVSFVVTLVVLLVSAFVGRHDGGVQVSGLVEDVLVNTASDDASNNRTHPVDPVVLPNGALLLAAVRVHSGNGRGQATGWVHGGTSQRHGEKMANEHSHTDGERSKDLIKASIASGVDHEEEQKGENDFNSESLANVNTLRVHSGSSKARLILPVCGHQTDQQRYSSQSAASLGETVKDGTQKGNLSDDKHGRSNSDVNVSTANVCSSEHHQEDCEAERERDHKVCYTLSVGILSSEVARRHTNTTGKEDEGPHCDVLRKHGPDELTNRLHLWPWLEELVLDTTQRSLSAHHF